MKGSLKRRIRRTLRIEAEEHAGDSGVVGLRQDDDPRLEAARAPTANSAAELDAGNLATERGAQGARGALAIGVELGPVETDTISKESNVHFFTDRVSGYGLLQITRLAGSPMSLEAVGTSPAETSIGRAREGLELARSI